MAHARPQVVSRTEVEPTGDVEKDIEVMRDYLKAKGLHSEVTTVQAMFRAQHRALPEDPAPDSRNKRDEIWCPS
jgi:hypothetical protein